MPMHLLNTRSFNCSATQLSIVPVDRTRAKMHRSR